MTINIIGVDPGGMTGVARFNDIIGMPSFWAHQVPGDQASTYLDTLIQDAAKQGDLVVACERFFTGKNTIKKTRQTITQDVIGAVQLSCQKYGVECVMQSAADAKKIGAPILLRTARMWTPAHRHANDAAAHIAKIIHNRHPAVWLEMIRPGSID